MREEEDEFEMCDDVMIGQILLNKAQRGTESGPMGHFDALALYSHRIIFRSDAYKRGVLSMRSRREWHGSSLGRVFDIDADEYGLKSKKKKLNPEEAEAKFRERWTELEERREREGFESLLERNFKELAEFLELQQDWEALLWLAIAESYKLEPILGSLAATISAHRGKELFCLAVPESAERFEQIKQKTSRLVGPLSRLAGEEARMNRCIPFFQEQLSTAWLLGPMRVEQLLQSAAQVVRPAGLKESDFDYMEAELGLLKERLGAALRSAEAGCNILLYGQPGTGKSQLARVVCEALGATLLEVGHENENNRLLAGTDRLERALLASRIMGRNQVLLLDECEGLINDNPLGFFENPLCKGILNDLLDTCPVPTIYICNNTSMLHPSTIRRFTVVMKMSNPRKEARARMVRSAYGDLISSRLCEVLASHKELVPGVHASIATSLRKMELAEGEGDAAALLLTNGHLKLNGEPEVRLGVENKSPTIAGIYNRAWINADANLESIEDRLGETGRGRLCLYGPPGSGKTAWGRYLAEKLDKPLESVKASDLLHAFVGETEKGIKKAFRSAQEAGAILLIDEVDGLLASRNRARASWELTQVNELLTQIEGFEGVLLATTNFLRALDLAAYRRFPFKINFGFLRGDQVAALYRAFCTAQGLDEPSQVEVERVARMRSLTLGDFKVLEERMELEPLPSRETLVEWLEREQVHKPSNKASRVVMGFGAHN